MRISKITLLVLVMLFYVFSFGCSVDNTNYKNIELDCGIIKIPNDWLLSSADDLIYFYKGSNRQADILAFQSNSYSNFKETSNSSGLIEKNAFSDKFQNLYTISSYVLSNGVIYGDSMVSVNETNIIMKYIDFSFEEIDLQLFLNSNEVSEETLLKIAESFEPK